MLREKADAASLSGKLPNPSLSCRPKEFFYKARRPPCRFRRETQHDQCGPYQSPLGKSIFARFAQMTAALEHMPVNFMRPFKGSSSRFYTTTG